MVRAGSARRVNAPKTGIPYTSHLGETNRLSHAKSATSHEQHVSYHETFVKLFWKLPRATKIFNQMNQLECYFGYWGIDFDLCLSPKHSSNMFRFLSSKRGDLNCGATNILSLEKQVFPTSLVKREALVDSWFPVWMAVSIRHRGPALNSALQAGVGRGASNLRVVYDLVKNWVVWLG